jgi:Na+-driven multidrug efflux pump
MFAASGMIPKAFNVDHSTQVLCSQALMLLAFILPIKAFNMHTIVGILRSGGDTRTSLLLELSSVWFVGVPLAVFGGLYLGLPLHLLYVLISLEEGYKMILSYLRIRSGRWIHDLTAVS